MKNIKQGRFEISEIHTLTENVIQILQSATKMGVAVKGKITFLNNVKIIYLTDMKGEQTKPCVEEAIVLFFNKKIAFKIKNEIYLFVTTENFTEVKNFFS